MRQPTGLLLLAFSVLPSVRTVGATNGFRCRALARDALTSRTSLLRAPVGGVLPRADRTRRASAASFGMAAAMVRESIQGPPPPSADVRARVGARVGSRLWSARQRLVGRASEGKENQFSVSPEPITREEAEAATKKTADTLINVFREREQSEWRHLLGFSEQWWDISTSVFDRISERANTTGDPDEELELRRMGRMLRDTHEEVFECRALWKQIRETKDSELESFISANKERIVSNGFFEYMKDMLGRTVHNDDASQEEKLAVENLVNRVQDLLQDVSMGIDEGVRNNMANIINAQSKEEAKKEIDKLAESGDLDPRYLALMNKAYGSGRDTWWTKDDHEETTLYMYEQMRQSMRKQQPLEIRLLKYVLAFPTPRERKEALEEVLTPGVRFDDEGWLTAETTTPEAMLARTEDLIRKYRLNLQQFGEIEPRPMYRSMSKRGDLNRDDIMRDLVVDSVYMYVPEVIDRLQEIRELIKSEFAGQLPENVQKSDKLLQTPDQDDVLFQGDNFMPF